MHVDSASCGRSFYSVPVAHTCLQPILYVQVFQSLDSSQHDGDVRSNEHRLGWHPCPRLNCNRYVRMLHSSKNGCRDVCNVGIFTCPSMLTPTDTDAEDNLSRL